VTFTSAFACSVAAAADMRTSAGTGRTAIVGAGSHASRPATVTATALTTAVATAAAREAATAGTHAVATGGYDLRLPCQGQTNDAQGGNNDFTRNR